jgi:hypothetical protein
MTPVLYLDVQIFRPSLHNYHANSFQTSRPFKFAELLLDVDDETIGNEALTHCRAAMTL